ncbi:MAG: hypothetical protein AVDCRST_MAG70-2433, partial [uncultured Thermomicrobiales bacterium]
DGADGPRPAARARPADRGRGRAGATPLLRPEVGGSRRL